MQNALQPPGLRRDHAADFTGYFMADCAADFARNFAADLQQILRQILQPILRLNFYGEFNIVFYSVV